MCSALDDGDDSPGAAEPHHADDRTHPRPFTSTTHIHIALCPSVTPRRRAQSTLSIPDIANTDPARAPCDL